MIREIILGWLLITSRSFMISCAGPRSPDGSQSDQRTAAHTDQDTSVLLLQMRFKPSVSESVTVVRALRTLAKGPHPPDFRRRAFPAQIYRLGQPEDSLYVLLAYQPRFSDSEGDHWGKAFYALRISKAGPVVSPPLDMKDAEYVIVDSVFVVDRDGGPEVFFCKGYEGEEELPRRMAATYRQGRWVDLSDHLRGSRECTPTRK